VQKAGHEHQKMKAALRCERGPIPGQGAVHVTPPRQLRQR
jgi:hypothetical protein